MQRDSATTVTLHGFPNSIEILLTDQCGIPWNLVIDGMNKSMLETPGRTVYNTNNVYESKGS